MVLDPRAGKSPVECLDMAEVRAEIDRLDAAMVALIAERFGYVDRAWQLKRAEGREGAHVPWRIQQVIDRVRGLAAEKGLPPEMVDMVGSQWRNMIGWFVQYEEEKLRKAIEAEGISQGDSQGVDGSGGDGNGVDKAADGASGRTADGRVLR